ncbi:trace amine-associated receptor 7a-like [Pteropus medius]|uniref:trace amine-associated receptor 7a-like n=1 Tax=Pteropus vampyrus TaxID=132908 RepID=UPI00196A46B5|nr:trace amine-associated receptor 7a-like [Pteropus giganteus]
MEPPCLCSSDVSVEGCWYFGESYCKFHSCFDGSFCCASIFHLCFISLDRYIAVSDPLLYPTRFTVSVSGICIAFSWLFSLIYYFTLFSTGANEVGLEELVSALTCVGGCQGAVNQSWVLVNFLLFFIATLVMIIVYSKIFLIAKQQARKMESMSNKTVGSSDSYKDRVARRERKAARTLGIAVIVFLVSWLPYFIDSIIDAFLGFITPTYILEILAWIGYYNSTMNPLIYALFYPWFRKAMKLIVTGQVLRESSSRIKLFSAYFLPLMLRDKSTKHFSPLALINKRLSLSTGRTTEIIKASFGNICASVEHGTSVYNGQDPGDGDANSSHRHCELGRIEQRVSNSNVPVDGDEVQVEERRVTKSHITACVESTETLPEVPAANHGTDHAEGHHHDAHHKVSTGQGDDEKVGRRVQLLEMQD